MATVELAPGLPIRNVWVRRLAVPVLFLLAFVLFVVFTFPYDDLARRIESEVRAQGGDLTIDRLTSSGLTGVSARGVKLRLPGSPGGDLGPELRFDRLDATIDVLPLLARKIAFHYSFQAYGGRGKGRAALARDPRQGALDSLLLDATDLDVQALPLKDALHAEATGKLLAKANLTQLSPPDAANGNLSLQLKGGIVNGAKVMGLALSRLNVGDVDINATVDKGVAKVEKTVARGGDIDADAEGTVRLKPLLSLSQADLKVRVKISDAWLNANPTVKGLLSAVGSARQPDGAIAYTLTGPLVNITPRPGR